MAGLSLDLDQISATYLSKAVKALLKPNYTANINAGATPEDKISLLAASVSKLAKQVRPLGVVAVHYARVFNKLGILPLSSALLFGYALTRQLTFQAPVWICASPPFQDRKYIGGTYQTVAGHMPIYTEGHWQLSLELGRGHLVFIGLDAGIASRVSQAARGEWELLSAIEPVVPQGAWSSEFAWLASSPYPTGPLFPTTHGRGRYLTRPSTISPGRPPGLACCLPIPRWRRA